MRSISLTSFSSQAACETYLRVPEGQSAFKLQGAPQTGWAAPAVLRSVVATGEDIAPYRNKACPGSVPIIIAPPGGYLTKEAAHRIALWDSDIIAFAKGCSPDPPGHADGPNMRLLLDCGKFLLIGISNAEQIADGDLIIVAPLPATDSSFVLCQVVAVRGVGGPWFEVEQVGPGVYALGEPGHYERAYSYLVVGEKRAALIDTGMGIDNIQREVTRLTSKPIVVINTHSHYDHVGDNHRFAEIALLTTPQSVAVAREGFSHGQIVALGATSPEAFFRPWSLPPSFDPDRYDIPPFDITQPLQGGEVFDLGGRTLRVLHTPGHSADSICLLDTTNRLLFTGDTFYPGTLYCYFEDSNLEEYARSARLLASLLPQLDYICPAHNLPRMNPGILEDLSQALTAVQAGQPPQRILERDPLGQRQSLRYYEWERFSLLLPA